MDRAFKSIDHEQAIYSWWEDHGFLGAQGDKPYTILMPPPNANASLHAGHGMYVSDDIMIRYKRLMGFASVWIPGSDHAGFETQFVYEKHLRKQKKSRLDFDRQTLYDNIYAFVQENSGLIFQQFRRLGFLADWSRSVFTLDQHVLKQVFQTFSKMAKEGIVYRDNYMVNYCTHCGTSLAELEVVHIERTDPLYYLKYGPFTLATVRPETKFGDTAVAVHPKDKRYKKWVGKTITVEGLNGPFELSVIADEYVDPKFGTGVVKITPAHDPNDFEIGKRHNLAIKSVISWDGRLNELTGPYAGMKVKAAREQIAKDLTERGLMEKVDAEYTHAVSVCYKCKRDLEPMVTPNWFIKVADLKAKALDAVNKDKVRFYPKKYKDHMTQWLTMMHDWPISRQIVWGIRIPVWYKIDRTKDNIHVWWLDTDKKLQHGPINSFLKNGASLKTIQAGLQKVAAGTDENEPEYVISEEQPDGEYIPETDTFDTWFSSGQWPLVTLKEDEYETRFPTDMMGTMTDILKLWISRMIMFSLYTRNEVPFHDVYLWSTVVDSKGAKMSKSKGNVINPIDLVDKYGADAFRASLVFGTSQGGRIPMAEEKVIGMRNFANKVWNIGRFIHMMNNPEVGTTTPKTVETQAAINALVKESAALKKKYIKYMDSYNFSRALDALYEFIWHRYADYYIETLKDSMRDGDVAAKTAMDQTLETCLQMLHPFMPFVTEALWKEFHGQENSILSSRLS